MNILFITQYYPPEIGAASNRIGSFARFLASDGHHVSILTTAPNYPEGKIYPGFANRWSVEREDGVRIYRTRVFLSAKKMPAARLIHYFSFVMRALLAKRRIPKPEVIVASSPPLFVGLIGVMLKKWWRVRLVLDIRDIWPASVESVGAVKNRLLLSQAQKLADFIYRSADHITVTSPGIQGLLQTANKLQTPTTVLPNGAELDLFRPDISGEGVRRRWNLGEKFVALYTGNLGLAQAPEIFLKTAQILKQVQDDMRQAQRDIVFLIVGAGVLLEKLQREALQKDLSNVIFTGNQPRSSMPEFTAAADVCLIPYKTADTFRNTFPSKMFDYMAAGKPIVINLQGEASELIKQAGCGRLAQEEDAKSLAHMLADLQKNPEAARRMGTSGRTFVEKHYRRETAAMRLEELLKDMLK